MSPEAHAGRRVIDRDMAAAAERFAVVTQLTNESYLHRSIFEDPFSHSSAAVDVPSGPSVACSSPAAIARDPSFANNADPSGRG